MSTPDDGVSVYIAANNHDDARALFEKSMELLATGADLNGELVRATPDGGVAQVYTHRPHPTAAQA
jgi:hypothetical protein